MSPSLDELVKQGEGDQDAVDLGDGVFMSRNIANSYLVTTSDGDLLINTGTDFEAPDIKARFSRVSADRLRIITFTQGHPDHVGGWSQFTEPGVQTIAQANHPDVREYWRHLHPFYVRRIMTLWGAFMDVEAAAATLPPEPELTDSFIDQHAFELGGQRFELLSTPGGETTDALVVWMPEHRTVFIGNLLGPFFGHVPNLYTLRGDKIRSAMSFIHSVDRVIALRPETLLNGHDVVRGTDEILTTMTKVRDATVYLRDRTIDGMNSGADVWTLMRDVTLPSGVGATPGARESAVDSAGDLGGACRLVPLRVHHRALRRTAFVRVVRHRRPGRRPGPAHRAGQRPTPKRVARLKRCT